MEEELHVKETQASSRQNRKGWHVPCGHPKPTRRLGYRWNVQVVNKHSLARNWWAGDLMAATTLPADGNTGAADRGLRYFRVVRLVRISPQVWRCTPNANVTRQARRPAPGFSLPGVNVREMLSPAYGADPCESSSDNHEQRPPCKQLSPFGFRVRTPRNSAGPTFRRNHRTPFW